MPDTKEDLTRVLSPDEEKEKREAIDGLSRIRTIIKTSLFMFLLISIALFLSVTLNNDNETHKTMLYTIGGVTAVIFVAITAVYLTTPTVTFKIVDMQKEVNELKEDNKNLTIKIRDLSPRAQNWDAIQRVEGLRGQAKFGGIAAAG